MKTKTYDVAFYISEEATSPEVAAEMAYEHITDLTDHPEWTFCVFNHRITVPRPHVEVIIRDGEAIYWEDKHA